MLSILLLVRSVVLTFPTPALRKVREERGIRDFVRDSEIKT